MVTDSQLDELRSAVAAALPEYLADLERLVNIDCGSYTKHGVDEVGRWVADQLRELGAEMRVLPHATYGDTVVGVLEGRGRGRALLIGHLDTVFEPGTAAERPFVIDDGRAYGPGVDDMKGGLLSGLYALRALRSTRGGGVPADWLPFERLTFVANPDEEIGSPSSTPHIKEAARDATVAFVLESARENGDIVSARKGIADFRLTISGRAAHAGVEPEKGRSATLEAAHKTVALHALNGRWEGVTVNVGAIHGGTRPNIVAEKCELSVDVRATSVNALDEVEAAIRDICETFTVSDTTCIIERIAHWPPMEKTPATGALAELAISLAARIGFELHDAATGGASDANTTSGMGVPSLDGLGPVGGADHAPGEYLEVDSIVPRTTLFAALLLAVAEPEADFSASS
ncbi:MAG TPA: M20 family metallopeptidase [Candidatus Limnocylindrales bacterium]|jgi:glutamate carboxypeptidase